MQLNYVRDMAPGFAGMISDTAEVQDIETFYSVDGPVNFGSVVTRGSVEGSCAAPTTDGGVTDEKLVKGIVVATHEQISAYPGTNPETPAQYMAKMPIPVMRKGRIWVQVEDQVTEGTSVPHVRIGGTGVVGAIRASDDGANASVLPRAKFKTSTTGPNQLAILEIDL
jgi:hypothetical protein